MGEYTTEDQIKGVELYLEAGATAAAKEIGCDRRTIYRWVGRHGVAPKNDADKRLETAERLTSQRHEIAQLLVDQIIDMMHRQNEPHTETRIGPDGVTEIVHHKATAADAKNYATTVGIFIDKMLLLSGEATSRSEISQLPDRALVKSWVAALEDDIAANG